MISRVTDQARNRLVWETGVLECRRFFQTKTELDAQKTKKPINALRTMNFSIGVSEIIWRSRKNEDLRGGSHGDVVAGQIPLFGTTSS